MNKNQDMVNKTSPNKPTPAMGDELDVYEAIQKINGSVLPEDKRELLKGSGRNIKTEKGIKNLGSGGDVSKIGRESKEQLAEVAYRITKALIDRVKSGMVLENDQIKSSELIQQARIISKFRGIYGFDPKEYMEKLYLGMVGE